MIHAGNGALLIYCATRITPSIPQFTLVAMTVPQNVSHVVLLTEIKIDRLQLNFIPESPRELLPTNSSSNII